MGKIDYFDIQVESGTAGIFLAGQRLTGNVLLRACGGVKLVGPIFLVLTGETRTYWVNKTSDKIYESCQQYFNVQMELQNPAAGGSGELLAEGVHTIPFIFDLPQNLLSTFEADFGSTRYRAAAKIRLLDESCFNPLSGGGGSEMVCEKNFSVLAQVGRGIERSMDVPVRKQEQTEVYGLLRKKGNILAEMMVPHQNFKFGEAINVQVTINNQSSQKIKAVELYLLQHARFEALSRYEAVGDIKEINRAVEAITLGEVPAKNTANLQGSLPIRAIPPSQNAGILHISYFLRLEYKPGNEIILPIAIYTVD